VASSIPDHSATTTPAVPGAFDDPDLLRGKHVLENPDIYKNK